MHPSLTENKRTFKMLCPMCHRIDTVESTLRVFDNDRYIAADVALVCPKCRCDMIEVDELMIPVLTTLHEHNIPTHSCCSMLHHDIPDPTGYYTKHDKMYDGPFIMFKNLREGLRNLLSFSIDMSNARLSSGDVENFRIHTEERDPGDYKLLTLEVKVRKYDWWFLTGANQILSNICMEWMEAVKTSSTGVIYADRKLLKRMRIPNYGNDDPKWALRNPHAHPYEDDDDEEEAESAPETGALDESEG